MCRVEAVCVIFFSNHSLDLEIKSLSKYISTKTKNHPEYPQHQHYRVKISIRLWKQVSGRGPITNWTEILFTATNLV